MSAAIEQALAAALAGGATCFGQIAIARSSGDGFVLKHREDKDEDRLQAFRQTEDAIEIAKFDNAGNYRPLKSAPNLRHGWRLEVVDLSELARALDYFYPGRLAMLHVWKQTRLSTTPLRETLDRQSGMYRIAAKISDKQIDDVVGNFCRSNGGCLRTILWKRDARGTVPSTKLPPEKFDLGHDQTGSGETTIPLLCQEACNLLVNECRKAVKNE
jgi:sirohydrochlorin cobaltochelatase